MADRFGGAHPVFSLITVDTDRQPHCCLLSRAEVVECNGRLQVALRSRRARANIERSGRATLLAVDRTGALLTLRLAVTIVVDEPLMGGYRAVIDVVERDELPGVPLTPMSFDLTPELAQIEDHEEVRRVLALVAATDGPPSI